MLKNLSLILALSVAVTACGGGSGGKKTPASSSVSSTPSSVAVSSSSSAPATSISVSSSSSSVEETSSSSSSSSSIEPSADLSYSFAEGINGWFVNGEAETIRATTNVILEHDMVNGALKISPLDWTVDGWRRFAKFNMGEVYDTTGATFTVVINVPQSYIGDAGLNFQWIVANAENTNTQYGDYITSASLTAGDNTLTITDRNLVNARYFGLQLSTTPASASIKDPVLIKSVEIKFAEASSSSSSVASSSSSTASSAPAVDLTKVDFESDAASTTYPNIGWTPASIVSTVVTISSITGLPANGTSTKVLRISPKDYNAGPVFNLTVPAGKTLGDYNVKVDAYLPRSSLGLTENGYNFYKPLLLVAGTELSGALNGPDPSSNTPPNPAYISQVGTAEDVDKWHTFTLDTNNSTLTGAIKVAAGVSRPQGTSADDYYFDNVRLEPK